MPQSPEARKQGAGMNGDMGRATVNAALEDFNRALAERDARFAACFHDTAVFIGSEPGELARGRTAIDALIAKIMASPSTVTFAWTSIETAGEGDILWFFADGMVSISSPNGRRDRPYGLTGVLVNGGSGWQWRLFHGSEPWIDPTGGNAMPAA